MEKKLKQKFIIIVYGSTGVGKSRFAEELAVSLEDSNMPTQLINCDIGQFYTRFGVGTAKPDWKSSAIKQHLFDIIDEPRNYSVSEYRELLFKTIEKIWEQDNIPILVGGSGFYIKSLFFPPLDSSMINDTADMSDLDNINVSQLWQTLHEIDPERATQINKCDVYRVRRALEIWRKTGKKPSRFLPKFDFPCEFLCIFLTRDRKELYSRIDVRTDEMVHEGWIEEVKSLMGTDWEPFFEQKKLIGYDVIVDFLKGNVGKDEAIKIIQKKTRNYAKRQITFWRSLKQQLEQAVQQAKSKLGIDDNSIVDNALCKQNVLKKEYVTDEVKTKIETINLTLLDLDLYIKQLVQYVEKLFN